MTSSGPAALGIRHLAVIPDGNRRWARARGLGPGDGHRAGIARAGALAAAAWDAGVEVFTVWWGSPANLDRRPAAEVREIEGALAGWLDQGAPPLLRRHGAAFEAIGRFEDRSPAVAAAARAAARAAGPGPRRLVVLFAYDGRDEVLAAADRLEGSGGSPVLFGAALWTGHLPPVDLVLRTGGEPHLSAGFLLWQIAEARLAFTGTLWPDLGEAELREVLEREGATVRRFGA